MKSTSFRGVVIGAIGGAVMAAGTVAFAGSGAGDVFNLGETNTVDERSVLVGATTSAELAVFNTGSGYGISGYGRTGRGIYGSHLSTSGVGAGIQGDTSSTAANAPAVLGKVTASGASSSSAALWGENSGAGYGLFARSASGKGGRFLGATDGLETSTSAASMSGLYAHHDGTNFGNGVFAQTQVGHGLQGRVWLNGQGVFGEARTGTTGPGIGVKGTTNSGVSGSAGVYGEAPPNAPGVWGKNTSGIGVLGQSPSGFAVIGQTTDHVGVYGSGGGDSGTNYGVVGASESLDGYAGYFTGQVHVVGALSQTWRQTVSATDTTPNVRSDSLLKLNSPSPIAITNLDNGRDGQRLTLLFANENTTIADNATVDLAGAADFTGSAGDVLELILEGGVWHEVNRSLN
jgi:hypothetical protein